MAVVDTVAEGMVAVAEGPMGVEAGVAAAMVAEVVEVAALGGVEEDFLAGVAKLSEVGLALSMQLRHRPEDLVLYWLASSLYLLSSKMLVWNMI